MSKLKKIQKKYGMLTESYAWERQEGKPLPTLADVQAAYNAKPINEQDVEPTEINEQDDESIDINVLTHSDFRNNGGPDLDHVTQLYKKMAIKLHRRARKSDNAVETIDSIQKMNNHMQNVLQLAHKALNTQQGKMGDGSEDPSIDNPLGL
jgi:hypothetical protein